MKKLLTVSVILNLAFIALLVWLGFSSGNRPAAQWEYSVNHFWGDRIDGYLRDYGDAEWELAGFSVLYPSDGENTDWYRYTCIFKKPK
jgi:hypothetical protein